ncbi:MAG TPA: hypothetical protein VNS58_11790 [Puia sp.]|nr:hypothetical protein [Puia sp.]
MPLLYIIFAYYYLGLLLSCFLTGCLFVRKSWSLEYKLLVILSGLTLLAETGAYLYATLRIDGHWVHNLFAPVECVFILYILHRASMRPAIKRLNIVLLVILPAGIGVIYGLHPAVLRIGEFAALFYLFLELTAACSFLIDLVLNKSDTPVGRQPLFWMAAGMLFYCSIFSMELTVMSFIKKIPWQYSVSYAIVANTFMYTGFITCFICLHRANPASRGDSPTYPEVLRP